MDDAATEDAVSMIEHGRLARTKCTLRYTEIDLDSSVYSRSECGRYRRSGIANLNLDFTRAVEQRVIEKIEIGHCTFGLEMSLFRP